MNMTVSESCVTCTYTYIFTNIYIYVYTYVFSCQCVFITSSIRNLHVDPWPMGALHRNTVFSPPDRDKAIWIYGDPGVDRIWKCETYQVKWDEIWKFNLLDFSRIILYHTHIYTKYVYCIYTYIYIYIHIYVSNR